MPSGVGDGSGAVDVAVVAEALAVVAEALAVVAGALVVAVAPLVAEVACAAGEGAGDSEQAATLTRSAPISSTRRGRMRRRLVKRAHRGELAGPVQLPIAAISARSMASSGASRPV